MEGIYSHCKNIDSSSKEDDKVLQMEDSYFATVQHNEPGEIEKGIRRAGLDNNDTPQMGKSTCSAAQ